MAETITMAAYPRDVIGKANRRLGPEGKIPGVVYGPGHPEPMSVAVDRHEFELFLAHHSAGSSLVELSIEGEKKPLNVVVRELQRSAVKGAVVHIDFLAVRMDQAISATVTLRLLNDPIGVREGGVLVVDMHEVVVMALPSNLPDALEVDISELAVGDSLHLSVVPLPEGVTLASEADHIVCSVQAPRLEVEVAPEAEEEEAAEPELVGKESESEDEE